MLPTIRNECNQFLKESKAIPLVKYLPQNYNGFKKVKVRKRNELKEHEKYMDSSIVDDYSDLMKRCVIAHPLSTFNELATPQSGFEPFFVFPINGYKTIYSKQIKNSSEQYNQTLYKLVETVGEFSAIEIFEDLLKYNYSFGNIFEGLECGSEIIIYGIPYYYAIRKSLVDDYNKFFYNATH